MVSGHIMSLQSNEVQYINEQHSVVQCNAVLTSASVGSFCSPGTKEDMMDENMFLEGTLSPTVSSCSSVRFSIFAIKDKTSMDLEESEGKAVTGVIEISEER